MLHFFAFKVCSFISILSFILKVCLSPIMNIPTLCDQLLACGQSLQKSNHGDKFNEAALLLLLLKKNNRLKLQQLDAKQHAVDIRKGAVNKAQLRLENLLYKQAYLLREIRDYKDFNSIELNKIETELDVKIGMDAYSNDLSQLHKNSLSILKKELQQRKLNRKQLLELEKKKEVLGTELNSKRKRLETFPEKVSKMKTLAAELFTSSTIEPCASGINQDSAPQLPLSDSNALQKLHHLSNPLYTLYHSLQSLSSASDVNGSLEVKIVEVSTDVWGVELTLSQTNLRLFTPLLDGSNSNSNSSDGGAGAGAGAGSENDSACSTILFQSCSGSHLITATISALRFVSSPPPSSSNSSGSGSGNATSVGGIVLTPPGNPEDDFLTSLFPNQPASVDLLVNSSNASLGDEKGPKDGRGGYLWVQWICGLRTLPPPSPSSSLSGSSSSATASASASGSGSVRTNEGEKAGKELFYSLNTVLDALKTRLTSTWRLTAILRLLTQHTTTTTTTTTPAFPLPPLLLSYYQLATQHLATSTALSANGAAQHQPAHSPFSPVSSTEVKITSLKPCAPPPMGQTHDPFASSSLLASATQMETEDSADLLNSAVLRHEDERQHCCYFKVSIQLTTSTSNSISGSSGNTATPSLHTETVIALIEISTQYPLIPPQVLLTSRKIANVQRAASNTTSTSSTEQQHQSQVDNTLKGIEQEINAGCVNFLEVPALARHVHSMGGGESASGDPTAVSKTVMQTITNSAVLYEAMDNVLLLQVSLLMHMLAMVSATRTRERHLLTSAAAIGGGALLPASVSDDHSTDQQSSAGTHTSKGGNCEDRRCLLANFYGRSFLS